MILITLLFMLSVNASEIDINYRWYKYLNQSYMTIEESKKIKDAFVDYKDYQIDEYYNIQEYNKIKGKYIYIYNKSEKLVQINNINITYKNNVIDYEMNNDSKIIKPQETIEINLKKNYYLKDIEIEIDYLEGNLDIIFSNKESLLARENINKKGKYRFYNIKTNKKILYKTYYNKQKGKYNKEPYEDYIYKDENDYKIYYFFYKDTITNKNTKIEDLLDTNYTLINYKSDINYKQNGKYKVQLIFEECEKNIEINVSINDNLNKIIEQKEQEIKNNKIIYEQNKKNYDQLVNLKNKCFEEIKKITNDANKQIEQLKKINYKKEVEEDYYKRYINKLKYVIDEKNSEEWNTKKISSFVNFKQLRINYDKLKEVR